MYGTMIITHCARNTFSLSLHNKMQHIIQMSYDNKRFCIVFPGRTNVHSYAPHSNVTSLLLLEQSMMGSDSGAWGNTGEREETEIEKRGW